MFIKKVVVIAAVYFWVLPSASGNDLSDAFNLDSRLFSAGPSGGTLGLGLETSYKLNNNFVFRANGTYSELDGIAIDFGSSNDGRKEESISIRSLGALIDWHPFQNGVRLTAGGRWIDFENSYIEEPSNYGGIGEYWIGNASFDAADVGSLSKSVRHDGSIGGYAGLGYDSSLFSRDSNFELSVDFGVVFLEEPEAKVTTGKGNVNGLEAAIREEEAELENDSEWLKYYPVVMFNGKYRF